MKNKKASVYSELQCTACLIVGKRIKSMHFLYNAVPVQSHVSAIIKFCTDKAVNCVSQL